VSERKANRFVLPFLDGTELIIERVALNAVRIHSGNPKDYLSAEGWFFSEQPDKGYDKTHHVADTILEIIRGESVGETVKRGCCCGMAPNRIVVPS